MSIKSKIQSLITAANTKTGESDTTLTDAVQTLVDGYGQGGGGIDLSEAYAACVLENGGATLHCYGQRIATNTYAYSAVITKLIVEPTVTLFESSPSTFSNLTTVEGCAGVTEISANSFRGCSRVTSLNFPLCSALSGAAGGWFRDCTALTSVTLGSVGHALATIQSQAQMVFQNCTQSGLTVTVYTTGENVDTFLTKIRNGATNATIVFKASETTTYGGNSYAASDTILTSTP